MEVAARAQVRNVALGPGREVIEHEDLPLVGEQSSARCEPMKPAPPVISALFLGDHGARS
jgi:hypothetical protein